jgi:hypothetical protein
VIGKLRILTLSALAVCAVGVAFSTAASAHEFLVCQEGGSEKFESSLCAKVGGGEKWSYLAIASGKSFQTEGKITATKLESTIGSAKVIISCEDRIPTFSKITLEPKGEDKTVLTLEKCTIATVSKGKAETNSNCTVSTEGEAAGTIKLSIPSLLVNGKGGGPEDELNLTTSKAEILIKGAACTLKGSYPLEGSSVCSISEAEVGLLEHELQCGPSGSKADLKKNPVGLLSSLPVGINGTGAGSTWYAT